MNDLDLSTTAQPVNDETPTKRSTDLMGTDFATEVKSDRLEILWRTTLAVCSLTLLVSFIFTLSIGSIEPLWSLTPVILIFTSLLTGGLLRRGRFEPAAWTFSLGSLIAISVAMMTRTEVYHMVMPFAFVLVVFVVGLLIRPASTFVIAGLSGVAMVVVPYIASGSLEFFGGVQVFALILTLLAAALAAQVTGELYAIAEWALMNYKRERRTNSDLFESRIALERSLKRSEALSERLTLMNAELENARAAAETAKNFRGQFLANMSHELRTPLNAIIGFSETMRRFPVMYDDVELPPAYAHDMDQIYNSGKQLLALINDILDLAKIDAGKLDVRVMETEIESIVTGVMATAHGLVGEKDIRLTKDLPDVLPMVQADPNRLRQVLLNLYSNALKFTDKGEVRLTIRETHEGVQFSVMDEGSGIAEEYLDVIFEEFKQAGNNAGRDPRAGSGLGLAISRQLLTLMGGRIWVESEVGKGSTFHFILQKASGQTSSAHEETTAQAAGDPDSERPAQEITLQ